MIVAVVLRCWAYDNVVFTGSADRVYSSGTPREIP